MNFCPTNSRQTVSVFTTFTVLLFLALGAIGVLTPSELYAQPSTGPAAGGKLDLGRFPQMGSVAENHAAAVIGGMNSVQRQFCEKKVGGKWNADDGSCDCGTTPCSANPCVLAGGKYNASDGSCSPHPWHMDGLDRSPADAYVDWQVDSLKQLISGDLMTFIQCMNPQIVTPGCPYCIPAAMGVYIDSSCDIPYINPGVIYEYWWPEAEIEINNFGIAAYNPILDGKGMLLKNVLSQMIHAQFKNQYLMPYLARLGVDINQAGIPSALESDPWAGNTSFAGLEPGDQNYHAEAHVYATSLQDRLSKKQCQGCGYFDLIWEEEWGICFPVGATLFNGYWKGNPEYCFYDVLDPPGDVVKAWTEDTGVSSGVSAAGGGTECLSGTTAKLAVDKIPNYAKYWRLPGCSKRINQYMYKASVPFMWEMITPSTQANVSLLTDDWRRTKSCQSYRLTNWGKQSPNYPNDWASAGLNPQYRYFELSKMGVQKLNLTGSVADRRYGDALDRICYYGGGELYPLVGSLSNHFSEWSSNAYLARRAIELAGQVSHQHLYNRPNRETKQSKDPQRNHCGGKDHVNRFSRSIKSHDWDKDIDKLQRIYPDVTECFKSNEIDDLTNPMFGGRYNQLPPDGSVRYLYWNKREACECEMRGSVSSPEKDRGMAADGLPWGWGCLPYPYDNYDRGRGNIEEEAEEALTPIPALQPFCNFPYIPGAESTSVCKVAGKSSWQSIVNFLGNIHIKMGPEKPCAENPPKAAWTPFGWADSLTDMLIDFEDYVYNY